MAKSKGPVLNVPKNEDEELDKVAQQLEDMATMILDEQPLDEREKKLLDIIYNRLDVFKRQNEKYHDAAKVARQVLHMNDPDQDSWKKKREQGKDTLQLQTLKSTINNVVADQMLSMPEARLLPETAMMQQAADDLQDMVHYVIYCANDFEQTHYRLCEDFYGAGTMVLQTAWDPDMNNGKGEIALIRWPLEAFVWDPMAENVQDCRAVMKLSWHPQSFFLQHYPDEGRYVSSERGAYDNVGMSDAQEDAENMDDEPMSLLIEYWWREYDAKTHRYTISVAYAAGGALLRVEKNVYNHGLYPFSILPCDTIEGCLAGEGLVTELRPMMQYINRYMSYVDMNLRKASKTRALVSKGSGIDMDALADWENDIIEGDRITPDSIQWMSTPPFNNMVTQMMLQLQTDLKQDSGANQFTRGETTGGIVSGKAINSLIQAGGKVSSMRTEQIKYFFKDMVEQIIWLMSQYYDDKRTMMITGRTGQKRELVLDKKEVFGEKKEGAVNPPPYTVQIEISSRDPQRIANQNQMFMEAYTMAAQAQQFFPLSALIEILNLDGKDRILPVIKGSETYQQQMQAMQQQLEQMGQALQQAQAENQSLKRNVQNMGNAFQNVEARLAQAPEEAAQSAMVGAAENNFGQQTGMPLPT